MALTTTSTTAGGTSGVQLIGTVAAPIVMGATGGASDVVTITHTRGYRAVQIDLLDSTNLIPANDQLAVADRVVVTQPSTNAIVLTNLGAGTPNCILKITWGYDTKQLMGGCIGTVGTYAGIAVITAA